MTGLPIALVVANTVLVLALSIAVVVRKHGRDELEDLVVLERTTLRAALTSADAELGRCLRRARRDIGLQAELASILRGVRSDDRLRLNAAATGLDTELARQLRHRRAVHRGLAVILLSRIAAPGTSALIGGLLADPDPDVRLATAGGLAAIGDAGAARALIAALDRGDLPAARVIERLGDRWAAPVVVDELWIRVAIGGAHRADLARALGLAGWAPAEAPLVRLLGDDIATTDERVNACRALASCGSDDCSAVLMRSLRDPAWEVRAQAVSALGVLHAEAAIALIEERLADEAWWVRANAGQALITLGAPGFAALERATTSDDAFARDRANEALELAGAAHHATAIGAVA